MQSVKSDEPRASCSGEWEELRGRVRHRVTEALDLITILLQDAVILLAGFLAEFAYEHWLHSSHPFFQLAVSLSSALFLLLYGITATVHIVHYVRGQFGTTSAGVLGQWLPWALAAGGVIAAAIAVTVPLGRDAEQRSADVSRVLIGIAPADQLLGVDPAERNRRPRRPSRTAMAWSPDGRTLVFSAVHEDKQQLYTRALDRLDATPIAGTDNGDNPFFSPDGQWVGFWKGGDLNKVPVNGGPIIAICKTSKIFGASWGSNGTIIFARVREGLWEVPATGGTPQPLTTLAGC